MSKAYSYIRFSTPEQLKGDSLRRQTDDAQAYCDRNGLILDKSLSFRDLGVSAFHGKHAKKGELGDFLKLVESGTIEKGSILIVENLDRLSRQEPITALFQLHAIVSAGINVVTTSDNKTYSISNINELGRLIEGIVKMSRSNEESVLKSSRGKSAWENKRKLAIEKGVPLTKMCPYWLKYDDGKFMPIPEVVDVIRQIYEMRLNGFGGYSITMSLNQMPDIWKPPATGRNRSGGWQISYIRSLLSAKTLIGEFTPCSRSEDNKQVSTEKAITNYYPAVIEKDLFNAVQNYNTKVSQIKGHAGGMVGKATNIFVGVIKCGICGSALHFIQKDNTFLHCDASRRKIEHNGMKCNAKSVHYDEVQRLILTDLEELDISKIMQEKDDKQLEINKLEKRIESIKYEIPELARKMDNLTNEMINEDNANLRQIFKAKLVNLDSERTALQKELDNIEQQLNELRSNGKNIRDNIDNANELNRLLQAITDDNKAIELRLKLRSTIGKIIKEIQVYPLDRRYKEFEQTDEPGILIHTSSKTVRKIRIRFNSTTNWRVLSYQSKVEIE